MNKGVALIRERPETILIARSCVELFTSWVAVVNILDIVEFKESKQTNGP